LEVSGAVRLIYRSLGVKRLKICTPHTIFFEWYNREEWDGWGM